MRTIRDAAIALTNASSVQALASIAAELGFAAEPMPLDHSSRDALGLDAELHDAVVARGPGDLRALLGECNREHDIRDLVTRTTRRLATRAPHMLWLLLLTERGGSHLAIATWAPSQSRVRIAALIANRTRILDSDAETLSALAASASPRDLLTHMRWLEILGRESLTRRFYLTLHRVVATLAEHATGPGVGEERQEIALLYVSRLLFLSFLEAKGWLDGDRAFLSRGFDSCCDTGGHYEHHVLRPLFFGTLNTRMSERSPRARAFGRLPFLNGGLFSPTPLERRLRHLRFGDEQLGVLFSDLLSRYRFTAREDSAAWSEAAIDPEMLGKSFESLMRSRDRKDSGAFYTPQTLVARVTRSALTAALAGCGFTERALEQALDGESVDSSNRHTLLSELSKLTVLDPACGSGAFLVHLLSELATLHCAAGDARPIATIRREVLARSIFGVDVNRTAVWLCELRLWLAVVIDAEEVDPMRVTPLPNLDHHIRVGDTLLGGDFTTIASAGKTEALTRLRLRYANSSGNRKRVLSRALDRMERGYAAQALETEIMTVRARRRDLLSAQRGHDLFGERPRANPVERTALAELKSRARELRNARRRLDHGEALPFSFSAHFPDVAASGGFGILIGNPPWVRLHRIPARSRLLLRRSYVVFRNAAWREGALAARAGSGFSSQVDLAALFAERSVSLLREGGGFAMLLPSKLWGSLAGGGVRELLRTRSRILTIEDWSDSPTTFDAAVYPSLLVARRREASGTAAEDSIQMTVHTRDGEASWATAARELGVVPGRSAPWLLLPPDAVQAFRALARAGQPLCETALGRPTLGVKCGLNDAFVLTVRAVNGDIARVEGGGRAGDVEAGLLRPALRGGGLSAWRASGRPEFVLWTHDALGKPMPRLPRHAAQWLGGWRSELDSRSDLRGGGRWWALFRTEAARSDKPRVVWSDFGKRPRALVLAATDQTVPLNSCYVCRCSDDDDAFALCALLNSSVAEAWLNAIAEPARGGFHRYLAWTVAMLPIPADWHSARAILAPLGRRATEGTEPDPGELLEVVTGAYGLAAADIQPLLQWTRP